MRKRFGQPEVSNSIEKHRRERKISHEMNISIEKNMKPGFKDARKSLFRDIQSNIKKKKKSCLDELGLQQTKERIRESLLRKVTSKYYKQWRLIQGRVATMGLMRTVANTYKSFGICGSRLKLSQSFLSLSHNPPKRKSLRIYPGHAGYSILAFNALVVFLYGVICFPLCVALGEDFRSTQFQYWCTLAAVMFLCLGMVLRLFTVDLVDGKPIDEMPRMLLRYSKSFLILDFFGSIPFEYAFDIKDELFISAIFLLRLVRVSTTVFSEKKLGNFFHAKIKDLIRSSKMMKVLETLFFTLLILHMSSCTLLLLSRKVPQSSTWLSK